MSDTEIADDRPERVVLLSMALKEILEQGTVTGLMLAVCEILKSSEVTRWAVQACEQNIEQTTEEFGKDLPDETIGLGVMYALAFTIYRAGRALLSHTFAHYPGDYSPVVDLLEQQEVEYGNFYAEYLKEHLSDIDSKLLFPYPISPEPE